MCCASTASRPSAFAIRARRPPTTRTRERRKRRLDLVAEARLASKEVNSASRSVSVFAGLACCLALLGAPSRPAFGQASPPSGSLTVVSRPSGASCRVSGDRVVLGRTPITLGQVSPGRYDVRCTDPAFESWSRNVLVNGARDDTVWMSLRAKTRIRAVLSSVIVPGWGQFYTHRPTAGWLYLAASLGFLGGGLVAEREYENRLDRVAEARSLDQYQARVAHADEAWDVRTLMTGGAVTIWALRAIDAAEHFPHGERERWSAGIEARPVPRGPGARIAARIDF
ncbi:MAG: PEGA domain-containing protein [Candidatus Eisenbacteria bacterium]|uniref:PEGA domain-containing protein n=1 Tax=Eiseniibacteriota bacterium TaxID=2212470 RepID=A0A538U3I0_UNCEI|nr:MAG: PEGA domain-containing protein [Candidatus Eisenbacteria bacterium]